MTDCDVLICGLGPVGVLLANLLGEQGVSVIAVDEAAEPYELPRAAVIDDEVLRILQGVGLADAVLADAQAQRAVSFVTAGGDAVEVLQLDDGGQLGHPPLVSINQPAFEQTLIDGARRYASVEMRRGCRVETVDRRAEHVVAWTRSTAGGRAVPVSTRWLVGCDGARSTVRSNAGIAFGGSTFKQAWLVVDAITDRPIAKVPHPHFIGAPDRPIVSLPMSPGRHRWEWMIHPGEPHEPFTRPARIAELMAPWLSGEDVSIERAVVYTFHARRAERWRAGRVLLAGDAAHVMPPFAGQGFSSGARDAANLAWKLAAVLRGAPESLLDTYEIERRPHVTAMASLAVRWGGIVQTTNSRVAPWRDRVVRATARSWISGRLKPLPAYSAGAFAERPARAPWRRAVGSLFPQPRVDGRLLDDALGTGWAAVARSDSTAAALARVLPTLRLHGDAGTWLDAHDADFALLRPDRFVFACGPAKDVPRALAAYRATAPGGAAPVSAAKQLVLEEVAA